MGRSSLIALLISFLVLFFVLKTIFPLLGLAEILRIILILGFIPSIVAIAIGIELDEMARLNTTARIAATSIVLLSLTAATFFLLKNAPRDRVEPPPALSPGRQSEISKAFDELPRGVFIFFCPKDMTVGVPEKCKARIANEKYLSAFEQLLKKEINEEFGEIKLRYISSVMNVKLTGEQFLFWKAFDIRPKEDGGNQLVIDKDFTGWEWDVTPQESGTKKLKFIVSVIIQVKGYQELPPKRYEENEVEIAIKINPIFSLANFIRINWKYLAIVIVIALVSVFISRKLKIVGTNIEVGSIGDVNVKSNEGVINLLATSRDISVAANQDVRGFSRNFDVRELIEEMPDSLGRIKSLLEELRQSIRYNPLLSEEQKRYAFETIKILIQVCMERKSDVLNKVHAQIAKLEEVIVSGSSVEAGVRLINRIVVALDEIL